MDGMGVIQLELPPSKLTTNAHVYCQQLEYLVAVLKKTWPALWSRLRGCFIIKKARPHTAKIISEKHLKNFLNRRTWQRKK